jgi:hypothetical protein
MPRITQGAIDQAEGIRQTLANAIDRARNDQTLSPVGRTQRIAAAWQQASTAMGGVRINFEGGSALNAQDIQRQVFGADSVSGADAISTRDAADRAAQLPNADEALSLLDRAELTGDDHLARAVAAHAYQASQDWLGGQDWSRVVDAYIQTRPDVAEKLQQLSDLRSNTTRDAINFAGYTYLLKPDELSRLSDGQIAALAGEETPAPQPAYFTRPGY